MIGRLNHVAIAVESVEKAAAVYKNALGAHISKPESLAEHGVKVIFVELPNTKIELLEPLGENSPIAGFVAKNPAGGIHHVCYEVDDILAAREQLKATGARSGRWRAKNWRPRQACPVSSSKRFLRHFG